MDRRSQYSSRVIRQAFTESLIEKPIEKITVQELCQKADVNRSTFYRLYSDVYALMDAVADECFHELFDALIARADFSDHADHMAVLQKLTLQALTVLNENRRLYQFLLFGKGKDTFARRLEDAFVALYLKQSPGQATAEDELQYRFVVCGLVGVLRSYMIDEPDITAERLAVIMAARMQDGIDSIAKHKV